LEQAFQALPEVLCGSRYPLQSYETGIVVATTLSVLQELNGRNVPNPLSCVHAEHPYRQNGLFVGVSIPRYLRADLRINTSGLNTGSRRLEQYGWRFEDWVEAKFFRGQTDYGHKHSTNKSAHTAGLVCDLVRLATLVPETAGTRSTKSRHLLHVYDSEPKWYLPQNRPWLNRLTALGTHEIAIDGLAHEAKTVRKLVGGVTELNLWLRIHNLAILPVRFDETPVYWCYLTRLDRVEAEWSGRRFIVDSDRTVSESGVGDLAEIVAYVAENISLQPADGPVPEGEDDEDSDQTEERSGGPDPVESCDANRGG
jgi:hypothetical protein